MKVHVLLLLLGATIAAARSPPFVGVPQESDAPDCQGDPETDRWRKDCNWCSCRNGRGACTRKLCPQGQEDDGPQCEGNASWTDDCNTCSCHNGQAVCTLKSCGSPKVPDAPDCQSESEDDRWRKDCNWCSCKNGRGACTRKLCPEGVEDDGPQCEGNPTWKDDCNTCSCHNGRAVCTLKHCGLPDESDAPDCQGDPETDRWRKDCNWCSCKNGRGACTRKLCPEGVKDDGPECEGNPTWKDDCNTCSCQNGRAVCTSKHCDQQGPQEEKKQVGDAQCDDGSRWRIGCNWCTCEDGVSHCTESACEDWNEDQAQEEGIVECHGTARWKKDCNWCNCVNGRGACTEMACIPPERDPFHNLPGNAVCVPGSRWLNDCNWCTCADTGIPACHLRGCIPGYVHEGPTCENGSVWKIDDCNICRCVDGVSACTRRVCPTSPQVPQVPEEAQCQGETENDRWRMDCNWCSCQNGVGACTRRLCPEGVQDEGPECEGNPSWMKDCNHCSCMNGTAVCTTKFCGPLPPRPAVHRVALEPAAQEPVCTGDPDTDNWTMDCNLCRCIDGSAVCTKRLCPEGVESPPICKGSPTWEMDCNDCFCDNGTALCSTKYCGSPHGPQTRRVQTTVVKQEKPVCVDGSRWRVACNWCNCHGGRAACTLKGCLDENAGSDEPECVGDATWKRDCNWCTCGDGLSLCTRMACLKPVEKPCTEGTSWRDDCNICRCSQGFVLCTKKACPKRGRQIECQGDSCGPSQLPELCHLPPVQGPLQCAAFFRKWSFSESEGGCRQIVYGGCGGTANLFNTEEACQSVCPSITTYNTAIIMPQSRRTFAVSRPASQGTGRCYLPQVTGPCFGAIPRYAYNSTSGLCEEFIYGGCAGNGNNFETKQECLAACQESQAVAPCDKSKCSWNLWGHYLAKECIPQYAGDACCPTSFHCPSRSESRMDPKMCYYKAVAYSIGDTVPVEDPCSASCHCIESHDPTSPPEINCANVECPELFRPPPPGCRPLYRADSCCPYDHDCVDPDAPPLEPRSVSCYWQNKTYLEGSKMYFDDYPCQSCICGPGFTDPTGPGCSKIDCGLEFRYTSEYHQGCTPVRFEPDGCCPISWVCPDDSRIIQQQQQPESTDESALCHLGDLHFAVGEVMGFNDCKIECRCMTPPELTCIQYRSCEAAEEAADQRACPPLQCGTGCYPVVSSPGQCPTCSCSHDIFSCPTQTCPSNCSPELDLQTGCPSCKCQCPSELICPTGCPSHTVLVEATGCPSCECKPGSTQLHGLVPCPMYPGGQVPCPQDCAIIKTVDENGCVVCKCNASDTTSPFMRPPPPRFCPREGEAPCPTDCAIIRRMDDNGCEVCECDPNNPVSPFWPFCAGKGQAPCSQVCRTIIRRMDDNGCEVCECDPNDPGSPILSIVQPIA